VHAHGHALGLGRIALDEGGVFLTVPIVPEGDYVERAEARWELGDRCDANTDLGLAVARTTVVASVTQQLLDRKRTEAQRT